MALTDENGGMNTTMLVTPASTLNQGNGWNGNGMFGDGNSWWFILLFIILFGGGFWGNNAGNNNGYGFGGQPVIVTEGGASSGNVVQRGFDQSAIMGGLNGIQSGVNGLATQICEASGNLQNTFNQGAFGIQNAISSGLAGVNANVSNGFAQAEIAANGRQMADMQQAFAAQTAMSQGFNATQNAMNQGFNQMGSKFADCCCENRLGLADLKYTVATENCVDRTQSMQNTRDIIESQTRNTQAILDKLCALELDGVKNQLAQAQRENVGLQNQLNMANLAASQTAQNVLIQQGFANEVDQLYNRLNSCPVPSTPVYGRTPIFTCGGNNGSCGCGCGGSF